MLKKLVVGALATGIMLSGGVGVSAAELNNTVPTVNNLMQANFDSKARFDITYDSSRVNFDVWGLQSIFHPHFYDEVIFTVEAPNHVDGKLYNHNTDMVLDDVRSHESNDINGTSDSISKKGLLKKLNKIYKKDIPNTVKIYAYAKPKNNSYYWIIDEGIKLNQREL